MNWISEVVRPKIKTLFKRETPDNLWHKCRHCNAMIFTREWEENDSVCPRCDHHGRIGPRQRFEALFRLAQPGLDLMLAAGDRLSRVVDRTDDEPVPAIRFPDDVRPLAPGPRGRQR